MILRKLLGDHDIWKNAPGVWNGTQDITHSPVRTSSGQRVTEESGYTYSAVYNAVTLIAESIGIMPHSIFRTVNKGKEKLLDHPLRALIHDRPNLEQSSQQFRELMQGWALTWGNGYSEIQRTTTGTPIALWPIAPDRVSVQRDLEATIPATERNPIVYVIKSRLNVVEAVIPAEDIFHIRNYSGDGVVGFSTIKLARESIGMGLAMEEFGANFFGNAAHPGGVLKTAKILDPEAKAALKKRWIEGHVGHNALGVAVLDEGMDWTQIGIPPEDAQFLQSRVFQIDEIARWYKVPPTMLAELSRAHFRNIEHLSIQYVTRSLMPWVKRWELEADWKLLNQRERDSGMFTKLNVNAELRGDTNTRRDFYKAMNGMGVFTVNNILEFEDMNTIGSDGDQRFVPMNQVPLESAKTVAENRGSGMGGGGGGQPPFSDIAEKSAMRTTLTQMQLILGKESNAAKRRNGKANMNGKAVEFYQKHCKVMQEWLGPFALSLCESILAADKIRINEDHEERISHVLAEFCLNHCQESLRGLEQAMAHNTVDSLCESWIAVRFVEASKELVDRVASCTMTMRGKSHAKV